MSEYQQLLHGEQAMVDFGERLGEVCDGGAVIYLQGDLGMGKTTLCRGVLRAFGHQGAVKSPTYTLVEPYELAQKTVCHFDLYRLADPEELEYMGIRDYFDDDSLCLIEWPAMGGAFLPQPDLVVTIGLTDGGRMLSLEARSPRGQGVMTKLTNSEA